ncbi:MAG: TldD/PmbA family protein [Acidobacteria bacterium]|nr:TldD/PmbA family protein [Acidobacteriota bacterium]
MPAERIFEVARKAALARGVRDVELLVGETEDALTRFANNAIHQNVADRQTHASLRVAIDRRTARVTTNRLDDASIERAVDQAVEIARCLEPDPDLPDLFEPEPIEPVERYHAPTAGCTPEQRARVVAEAIRIVESAGQTAAGIFSTGSSVETILNTRGVAATHRESMTRFSITAMAADSSGWAKASATSLDAFDPAALARRASVKAARSAEPRELEPGKYTVILEPAAVSDLVGQMFADFSGTAIEDQRSFLTGRLGEKLFGSNIHVTDDVRHPLQAGAPFDGEGVPRRLLKLIDAGVPTEVAWSRQTAGRNKTRPTGHGYPVPNELGEAPQNIVIHGGDSTLDRMIASTGRGILVTRLWYIREVDPFEKIMTGMTRDGTFLIEDGRVVCGVRNFRFNQSLIEMLNNVEAMSATERVSAEEAIDMTAPAMKAHEFNFTEVTRF